MMKKVRYSVGKSGFALRGIGEIIEGYLITQDQDSGVAMIFFPENEEGCGNIVLCKENNRYKEKTFVNLHDDAYINLDRKTERAFFEMIRN